MKNIKELISRDGYVCVKSPTSGFKSKAVEKKA